MRLAFTIVLFSLSTLLYAAATDVARGLIGGVGGASVILPPKCNELKRKFEGDNCRKNFPSAAERNCSEAAIGAQLPGAAKALPECKNMLEFYAHMMRAKSCKEVVEKAKDIKVDDK
jgi:hypothetical protein